MGKCATISVKISPTNFFVKVSGKSCENIYMFFKLSHLKSQ